MRIKHLSILLIGVAVLLSSCREKQVPSGSAVPYVAKVLGDPSLPGHKALMAADGDDVSGAIALIGSPESCLVLSEYFLTGDDFDNIDGRRDPDGLPDFAGETIVSYMDAANTPYEGFLSHGNELMLREIMVRNLLSSLDTLAGADAYGDNHITKPAAKMIVIASPVMEAHARADIDTLFHISGRNIPVIWAKADPASPEDTLGRVASQIAGECYRIMREKNSFTHNIAWPKAKGLISYPKYGFDPEVYTEGGYFEENYKYSRPNNYKVDTYTFIGYSDEYMPDSLLTKIRTEAIRTYRDYVQD